MNVSDLVTRLVLQHKEKRDGVRVRLKLCSFAAQILTLTAHLLHKLLSSLLSQMNLVLLICIFVHKRDDLDSNCPSVARTHSPLLSQETLRVSSTLRSPWTAPEDESPEDIAMQEKYAIELQRLWRKKKFIHFMRALCQERRCQKESEIVAKGVAIECNVCQQGRVGDCEARGKAERLKDAQRACRNNRYAANCANPSQHVSSVAHHDKQYSASCHAPRKQVRCCG
jgi:hypothetical protein